MRASKHDKLTTYERYKRKRWTPIARGSVYCSPACGHACKRKNYERAKRGAASIAKKLGAGWEPEVWENLDWHYHVRRGALTIAQHDGEYTAHFSSPIEFCGYSSNPHEAVASALSTARVYARRILDDIAKVQTPDVLRRRRR